MTYNNYRCHITPVYKSLNILKLHNIHKLELAKLMYKFHYEMLPTSFKDLFQKTAEVHCHNTICNQPKLFHTTSFNKRLQKKTISHRGSTLWANVDQQFKDKSHNAFSNHYRSFLLLQYGEMSEKLY